MRLTTFTDYSLRVLLHLALHQTTIVTVHDIAEFHGLSHHHLTKVAHALGQAGWVETLRGRHGGLRLRMPPHEIRIGAVVRIAEPDFHAAQCFDPDAPPCLIADHCGLRPLLARATWAFLNALDAVTLEDLIPPPSEVRLPSHGVAKLVTPT
jgi:Rrf2 family nitric oxide-sensitive transcriptional repressor